MIIRDESPADRPHIDLLLDEAFGGTYESRLVARLRQAGLVAVALVGEEDGQIIGHIVMSRLPAQLDGRAVRALALAPMAVQPDRQRRGVGARLLAAALERARAREAQAIFVLGHPAYYSRFGFSSGLAAKITAPFTGPSFMALELVPGTLSGVAGAVAYPAAFERE
ncbi:MAG TPA: N-acetyltransferase [Xanthobacteraceae bacterium]|nr:N-acetyltransferase [Xanthobacteraceae bacterium]